MPKMYSLFSSSFLAEAAAPAGAPQQGGFGPMVFVAYGLLIAAMYFFMIAPQRKKQKEHAKMLAEIQSGDEIMTSSGIFGVITNIKDDRFVVRIADNTKVEIAKGFVQAVLNKQTSEKK